MWVGPSKAGPFKNKGHALQRTQTLIWCAWHGILAEMLLIFLDYKLKKRHFLLLSCCRSVADMWKQHAAVEVQCSARDEAGSCECWQEKKTELKSSWFSPGLHSWHSRWVATLRHWRPAVPHDWTSLQLPLLRQELPYGRLNCSLCVVLTGVFRRAEGWCLHFPSK